MSAESETSEIIRGSSSGGLPDDVKKTAAEYADRVQAHPGPKLVLVDHAKDAFASSYPFHPTPSVLERNGRRPGISAPQVLRLLALWVNAYQTGSKGAHKDPLIGMGTAPLMTVPIVIFEQLGGAKLRAPSRRISVGKRSGTRPLDKEAIAMHGASPLRKSPPQFFESNGGQRSRGDTPGDHLASRNRT